MTRAGRLVGMLWLPLAMVALYLAAVVFRPLFPVDETRYMTVAWEMYLRQGWFAPLTLNFEPYHHKPPLLFWLINMAWSVFGVSRWAGLIPLALASTACVYLTARLGAHLFPAQGNRQRIHLIMAGSIPFMIYGTLVMFDFMVCMFVLLSLICLLKFRADRRMRHMLFMGLCLGFGVLAKGPVAYLYVLPAALLAPLWMTGFTSRRQWYGGVLCAVLVSVLPILVWLVPVLRDSNGDFAFWLLWNQTAGRITGNFEAAHIRPVWFYLPLVPAFLMPWVLLPRFWQGARTTFSAARRDEGLRFLIILLVPVFVAFSCISGKQPHYMVPLIPAAVLVIERCLADMRTATLAKITTTIFTLFIVGQGIASQTIFQKYDLAPVSSVVQTDPERELAFVRNYHGEIGFMAKRTSPLDNVSTEDIHTWFATHPKGWAVIRYEHPEEIRNLKTIMSYPYRGKTIGVFEQGNQ